ncbi:alpha/beta fold hydrolase [Curvibacter sp. RS43]|uniref:bifunctional 4-carboxymuconolactone decarboxylase/3-oxoadipate enol-lactonase PcaCD n=1 Tax=Curvibacter microcysteis TaxID=3026419 RepID=UPI00235EAD0D|nr:alpha/beta fold hydrolase [Curvibacter sp. RS43]MDD0812835.1 alpha/beta fold hydrolase [Curvibacter sp. RS43]
MRQDDFERGLTQRRKVLGEDWVTRATTGATAFTAQWQEFITRTAWHAAWCQDGLETETRRLLAMTSTLALGRWEEFEMHVHAALRAGISETVLQDMLRLSSVYCGVPAANTGFRIAAKALATERRPSPPAPLTPVLRERSFHTFSEPQMRVMLQGPESGVPVVLCHALGLDSAMWSRVAAHLAERGHPVMRYDLRGHGGSDLTSDISVEALVEDAARLVAEWGKGPVVFVGLSLGGLIAQGLAIRQPALVRALVLANTVAAYPPSSRESFRARAVQVRDRGMAAVVDEVLQRYVSASFQREEPEATALLRSQLSRCDAHGYAACCDALAQVDWMDELSGIQAPTWIVSGAADVAAPPVLQEVLVNGIAHSHRTVLECGHLPVLEAPEAFLAGLSAFLAKALRGE